MGTLWWAFRRVAGVKSSPLIETGEAVLQRGAIINVYRVCYDGCSSRLLDAKLQFLTDIAPIATMSSLFLFALRRSVFQTPNQLNS